MKTKNRILLLVSLLMGSTISNGQTNYYAATQTIDKNGFTYQCDNPYGRITLYNANSQFIYAEWERKDGQPVSASIYGGREETTEEDDWTARRSWEIVDSVFTQPERTQLMGAKMMVTLIISSDTGRVIEVKFQFLDHSAFTNIPVEKFYSIEQALKQNIWFIVTPVGRQMNYLMAGWMHEIK